MRFPVTNPSILAAGFTEKNGKKEISEKLIHALSIAQISKDDYVASHDFSIYFLSV